MPADDKLESVDLRRDWADLRPGTPPPEASFFNDQNDFVLGTSTGRIILKITAKGRVQLGPQVDLDEASEIFWTNLAIKREGMEERLLHFQIMEHMLLDMADADRAYEAAQLRAQCEGASAHDQMMEEISRRSLESQVHLVMEFARGLRRPLPPESTPP